MEDEVIDEQQEEQEDFEESFEDLERKLLSDDDTEEEPGEDEPADPLKPTGDKPEATGEEDADEDEDPELEGDSEKIAKIADRLRASERYKGASEAVIYEIAQQRHFDGKRANEIGDLRKEIQALKTGTREAPEEKPETQEQKGPNGYALDEYGLEAIPRTAFFSDAFLQAIKEELVRSGEITDPDDPDSDVIAKDERADRWRRWKQGYESQREEAASRVATEAAQTSEKNIPVLKKALADAASGAKEEVLGITGNEAAATEISIALEKGVLETLRAAVTGGYVKEHEITAEMIENASGVVLGHLIKSGAVRAAVARAKPVAASTAVKPVAKKPTGGGMTEFLSGGGAGGGAGPKVEKPKREETPAEDDDDDAEDALMAKSFEVSVEEYRKQYKTK